MNGNSGRPILRIFRSSGGNGKYVFDVENINEADLAFIRQDLNIDDEENILIGGRSPEFALAISEKFFTYKGCGEFIRRKFSEILDATIDMEAISRAGCRLSNWPDLILHFDDGKSISIRIEPGLPFSGVWNVIRRAGSLAG